ncbi:hypothetical protein [Amycolatopsis magusensis]
MLSTRLISVDETFSPERRVARSAPVLIARLTADRDTPKIQAVS